MRLVGVVCRVLKLVAKPSWVLNNPFWQSAAVRLVIKIPQQGSQVRLLMPYPNPGTVTW